MKPSLLLFLSAFLFILAIVAAFKGATIIFFYFMGGSILMAIYAITVMICIMAKDEPLEINTKFNGQEMDHEKALRS